MPFHLTETDPLFPQKLREIPQPPHQLWCEGDRKILANERMIAIVGAREATAYGEKIAFQLAKQLTEKGVVVVSGLALGIDSAAHRGALAGSGKTIAVLGCGLESSYLKENILLRREVSEKGLVLSEYPGETPASRWSFPQRNRIISGLADGVVVVEAAEKSGSLITAEWAWKQGKKVFAVPGNIQSPMSEGTNRLIQKGAKLILNGEDILREFSSLPFSQPMFHAKRESDSEEAVILSLLSNGKRHMDELSEISGFAVPKLSVILLEMELAGSVRSLPGGNFERNGA